jgi:Protein of unknown function (DUF2917)
MRFTINRMPIGLSTKTPLSIDEAGGFTLRVLRGRVWVTQEGCGDDVFLDPGCGHHFERDGRVIVSVEGGADASATVLFDGQLEIQSETNYLGALRRFFDFKPSSAGGTGAALGCP